MDNPRAQVHKEGARAPAKVTAATERRATHEGLAPVPEPWFRLPLKSARDGNSQQASEDPKS
eukprot:11263916-Alexandrium_andersonii.AAC.1